MLSPVLICRVLSCLVFPSALPNSCGDSVFTIIPQTDLSVGVLTVLYYGGLDSGGVLCAGLCAGCVDSFLCAGCGNGESNVAPVYAKHSVALVFAVNLNGFV